MGYKKRLIDEKLANRENLSIGIVITGVRGCGKTETSKQFIKSEFIVDDKEETKLALEINPNVVLEGEKPRLIDEWQLEKWIWNKVRHAVDNKEGCFILTGSATPVEDDTMHTGANRFIFLHMRPMSWYEREWSTGEITLENILKDKVTTTKKVTLSLEEKLKRLKTGGWPAFIDLNDNDIEDLLAGNIKTICKKDLRKVDGKSRNEELARALLMSLSRNIGTNVADTTIIEDIKLFDNSMSKPTFDSYYNALKNIHVIEELPAWSTHIRSASTLRKGAKRYFVDPSLAVASLELSIDKMKNDLKYVGFLFENEVIKNLRIYAESVKARLYYFGNLYSTHENGKSIRKDEDIDLIMEFSDGNWAAFEIKFAFHEDSIKKAAEQLNSLIDRIDFNKVKKPLSLNIITCDGFAYKRKEDGINVIPLCSLKGK